MPQNKPGRKERNLSLEEVQRLVSTADREAANRSHSQSWPGKENLAILANAVKDRRMFVTFLNGVRFKLKYNNKNETVFVKPADGGFVPCGYFSYRQLKDHLAKQES